MALLGGTEGLYGAFFNNLSSLGGGSNGGAEKSALGALKRLQAQVSGSDGTQKADSTAGAAGALPLKGLSLEKLEQMANGEIQNLGTQANKALDNNLPKAAPVRPMHTADASPSFASLLGDLVDKVDQKDKAAGHAVQDVMLGKSGNIHQAMIAMQEASVSFSLLVEVRNKLVDSYKELTRMQV